MILKNYNIIIFNMLQQLSWLKIPKNRCSKNSHCASTPHSREIQYRILRQQKGLVSERHKPFLYGAIQRIRTADRLITNQVLYQLS